MFSAGRPTRGKSIQKVKEKFQNSWKRARYFGWNQGWKEEFLREEVSFVVVSYYSDPIFNSFGNESGDVIKTNFSKTEATTDIDKAVENYMNSFAFNADFICVAWNNCSSLLLPISDSSPLYRTMI